MLIKKQGGLLRKCGYGEPCVVRSGHSLLLYSLEAEKRLLGRLEPGSEVSLAYGWRPRDFLNISLEDEGQNSASLLIDFTSSDVDFLLTSCPPCPPMVLFS